MRHVLASLALLGLAAPVSACINDVELPNHEREFRSQYRGNDAPPPPTQSPGQPSSPLLLGAGSVLMAGAVAVAWITRRPEV